MMLAPGCPCSRLISLHQDMVCSFFVQYDVNYLSVQRFMVKSLFMIDAFEWKIIQVLR
ncbi:hypothetical protein AFERRI_530059 [Acidithiobacillus ferrivorans]|uniref:Uncharacterized protein n=2 Tax=Acidithiobacillus ferrivorans TaxID=160808 RepID=A0A060UXB0_9PROT|nr:hypothetical protein AFERRI_530059 [Acidithiobacillus ferrivorans]